MLKLNVNLATFKTCTFNTVFLMPRVIYKSKTIVRLLIFQEHTLTNNLVTLVLKICFFVFECLLNYVFIVNSFYSIYNIKTFCCRRTNMYFFNPKRNVYKKYFGIKPNMSGLDNFLNIFAKLLKNTKRLEAGTINNSGKVVSMGDGIVRVYGLDDDCLVLKRLLMYVVWHSLKKIRHE